MRPTFLEINLDQLKTNLQNIRTHTKTKIMVMVKANAYGHGIDGVAPFIEPYTDYFGVALVEEGIHLRNLGIKKPILVAGGTLIEQLPLFFDYDLILTASSPDLLTATDHLASSRRQRIKVHLKIDTGMERIGVHEYEAESFLSQSLACSQFVEVDGIYTHLANSEVNMESIGYVPQSGMPIDTSTSKLVDSKIQLQRFEQVTDFYKKNNLQIPMRHVCNSGGILNLPEAHFEMVRAGVIFYGVYPARDIEKKIEVKPALTWKSKVAYSKITQPGRSVSYGSLYQVEDSPKRLVTVPCGYADGYFRRMTNQASVLINGKKYPQVGRICMDQFMVNVGDDDVKVGDDVILLGDEIEAENLADWCGTNEYEVMTNINTRVPRVFVE